MEMFPKDYKEFIEKYQTKEPKFGDYYIPALKARQALEHYAAAANEKGISLAKAIDADPTYVIALGLKAAMVDYTNLIIECIRDSHKTSIESINYSVIGAIEKHLEDQTKQLEDQTNHPEEELKLWNGATL